jgi:hypothetical protein
VAPIEGNFRKMSTELPAPPQAAQPPAPQKKSGGTVRKILVSIVGLVVVAGAVYAFNYFTSDVAQAKAGDCGKVTGTESKPDYTTVGCDSADANVTVGKAMTNTAESCGEGDYLEFTMSASRGPDAKLCLIPKLEEGQCYPLDTGDSVEFPKQACSADNVKVAKIVKGTADQAACGETGAGLVFSEPATTFCLEPGA